MEELRPTEHICKMFIADWAPFLLLPIFLASLSVTPVFSAPTFEMDLEDSKSDRLMGITEECNR